MRPARGRVWLRRFPSSAKYMIAAATRPSAQTRFRPADRGPVYCEWGCFRDFAPGHTHEASASAEVVVGPKIYGEQVVPIFIGRGAPFYARARWHIQICAGLSRLYYGNFYLTLSSGADGTWR